MQWLFSKKFKRWIIQGNHYPSGLYEAHREKSSAKASSRYETLRGNRPRWIGENLPWRMKKLIPSSGAMCEPSKPT